MSLKVLIQEATIYTSVIGGLSNMFILIFSLTATGNVLCAIDSLGQLYLYRLSPISDPCGPHVPASLQTMFEFCLVSALDWWDLTVCLKPTDVEAVCSRLEENFSKQSASVQDYYHSRYMSLKRYLTECYPNKS
jgi:hypothetical protein